MGALTKSAEKPKGERVCDWIERNLPLVGDDVGEPIRLRPWQRAIITKIFGTLDDNGRRIIRTVYIQLPRKAAKTFLAAVISLVALVAEKKSDQEIYTGSWTAKQTDRLFGYLCTIINCTPWLRARCAINRGNRQITFLPRNNVYRALTGAPEAGQSISPSVMVIDELWMFKGIKGQDSYDGLTSGFTARREPLLVIITTAGKYKNSVCFEEYKYAKKVQTGEITNPTYLPIIHEMDEADDPFVEANWFKANPALGDYADIEEYRKKAARAKISPSHRHSFFQLYLNKWVDSTSGWISLDSWEACKAKYTLDDLKGKRCYAAYDHGITRDLAALTLIFPTGNKYRVLSYAWIPRGTIDERLQAEDKRYQEWLDDKLVRATSGNANDREEIQVQVLDILKQFDCRLLGVDPYSLGDMKKYWRANGVKVHDWLQSNGPAISAAAKILETAILNKRIEHDGNEMLTWCVTNAQVKIDAFDNIKPLKRCDGGRIDPLIALVMAMGVAHASKKVPTPGATF
jgi:phage terminase large subunit-like protein